MTLAIPTVNVLSRDANKTTKTKFSLSTNRSAEITQKVVVSEKSASYFLNGLSILIERKLSSQMNIKIHHIDHTFVMPVPERQNCYAVQDVTWI
jgi:hypothetical protein